MSHLVSAAMSAVLLSLVHCAQMLPMRLLQLMQLPTWRPSDLVSVRSATSPHQASSSSPAARGIFSEWGDYMSLTRPALVAASTTHAV